MRPLNNFSLHLLLSILLLNGCATLRFPVEDTPPAFSKVVRPALDTVVKGYMESLDLPGIAIGVVKDGVPYYAKGYGWASVKTKRQVAATTTFHTASISKIFTALAIMHLRDSGKLKLDQSLVDILPSLTCQDPMAGLITIRQLLNHTSGLPDVKGYNWGSAKQEATALKNYFEANPLTLESAPGKRIAYSNVGYDLLGLVVGQTSETDFEQYVQEAILLPAGMTSSEFRYFKLDKAKAARPHTKGLLNYVKERRVYPYNREHAPSSTLNASAVDLTKWMAHFLNRIPQDTSLTEMTTSSTSLADWIGLGFQRYDLEGKQGVGHYGGDQGFRSYLLLLPAEQIGIVVLGNCDYEEDFRQKIALGVLEQLRQ